MALYPAFNKTTLAIIALLLIAISGLTQLTTNASYLAYFDENDPLVKAHLNKRADFSRYDNLILIIQSKDQSPLSSNQHFYRHSKKLVTDIALNPRVKHVSSYLKEYRWRSSVFSKDKPTNSVLLSKDGRSGLILIDTQLADNKDAQQILHFNQSISQLVETHFKDAEIDYFLSGELGLNNAYITTLRHDLKRFLPLLLVTMVIALGLLLLNFKLALGIFSIGLLSTLAALGTLGWLGFSLTSINAFTPIIIIGLSIVTNMHNCIAFYQRTRAGQAKHSALKSSFYENLTPVTMSCLTTAGGFLFLLLSPSPPIIVTGIACALGLLFSWLLSISLYQIILLKAAPKSANRSSVAHRQWRWPTLEFIKSFTPIILILACLITVLGAIGLSKLSINDNVYRYFPKDYSFRQSIDILKTQFNGVINIDYVIKANTSPATPINRWSDTQWQEFNTFNQYLTDLAQVKSFYPSPQQLNLERINTFYEKQNTSKSSLHTYIDKQGHQLRIQITLNELSSKQLLEFESQIKQWIQAQNFSAIDVSDGTSADILFANLSYNNASSMFISLLIALSIISAISGLLLKSLKLSVLVFICNFLPIISAYGFLGLTGGYLTLGSTVVIGMIIGIIVDDTLHLLFKFRKYCNKANLEVALTKLQQRVFSPVILSSAVIILALSIGLVSDFRPTFEISLFSISVIIMALLTDIILLPSLLLKWANTSLSSPLKNSET